MGKLQELSDKAVSFWERLDGWGNLMNGLGVVGRDKSMAVTITQDPILGQAEIEALFRNDGIARRMVTLPAGDMTRKGFTIQMASIVKGQDVDADQARELATAMMTALKNLKAVKEMRLRESGQQEELAPDTGLAELETSDTAQPVDEDKIEAITFLRTIHRFQYLQGPLIVDPESEWYGEPEWFDINQEGDEPQQRFHRSRVLLWDGVDIPLEARETNDGEGDSIYRSTFQALASYKMTARASATLAQDFSQGVFTIKGLNDMLRANEENLVVKRFRIMDQTRGVQNAILLDADSEEFRRDTASVAGLTDMVNDARLELCASAGMPMTKLFMMPTAGFAAEDKSGDDNWDDTIQARQDDEYDPNLRHLMGYLWLAKEGPSEGLVPDSWSNNFNPLTNPTPVEEAEERKLNMEADTGYIKGGVLLPNEVAESRFGGDEYGREILLNEVERAKVEKEREAEAKAALAAPASPSSSDDPEDPSAPPTR